jgi:short-subunit dehydrogenase
MKVVISGATSGVGFALTRKLALAYHDVIAFGRREKFENYKGERLDIQYHSLDYTGGYSFDCVQEEGIDAIVHCSAQFKMARLRNHSGEQIHNMISTNLTSAIEFVRYFQPRMKRGGKIIFLSSVSGLRGQKNQTVYSATKHAIQGFADSLRQEIPQKVTTICPGGIDTPLWNEYNPYPGNVKDLLSPYQVAEVVENVIESIDLVYKNITLYPENESH